ncbi:MAG: ABC transporter ATP-binding protein [Verrucomicrobia bacterium]|nr:ABC transporter ATP-binding protein [Verrucomicrobiota bacterium]
MAATDSAETSGLSARELTRDYPTRAEPLRILRGVNLSLARGDALAVTGPSGSGKSTLLHIFGALDRPTAGEVLINGRNPFALPEPELAAFRNREIGFVFQEHYLLPQCSVLENVLVPTIVAPDATGVAERARMLLDRVGLANRLDHRPAELSGGERQRVAIARALINRPTLLLCDEPTGNLDRVTARSVADVILEMAKAENATLIVVTHSAELAARLPRRMELVEGKLEEKT